MNYEIHFENSKNDIYFGTIVAPSVREAIIKAHKYYGLSRDYVPVKCEMVDIHDVINYKSIRSSDETSSSSSTEQRTK